MGRESNDVENSQNRQEEMLPDQPSNFLPDSYMCVYP